VRTITEREERGKEALADRPPLRPGFSDLFITKEFEGGILDLFILRELLAQARKARADEVPLFGRGFEWMKYSMWRVSLSRNYKCS
jgi:hypothetical protein